MKKKQTLMKSIVAYYVRGIENGQSGTHANKNPVCVCGGAAEVGWGCFWFPFSSTVSVFSTGSLAGVSSSAHSKLGISLPPFIGISGMWREKNNYPHPPGLVKSYHTDCSYL
jgi:hypothetical protein